MSWINYPGPYTSSISEDIRVRIFRGEECVEAILEDECLYALAKDINVFGSLGSRTTTF